MLASLAMLARDRARCAWLRVAACGSAPPISFVARRGLGTAMSGRESRLSDRTGKQDLRCRRLDDSVAFRIKRDDANRCPVAGLPAPALRVACACILVERVAGGEHAAIQSGMTLRRGDVADAAMAVFVVIPLHEARRPLPCGVQIGEPLERETPGRYFAVRNSASAKALSSLTRGREFGRKLDAEPVQHGQHGCCFQSGAVIAVQHRTHPTWCAPTRRGPCAWPDAQRARRCRCHAPQSSRPCGCRDRGSGTDRDQVTLDLCRQECDVPAPDLAGGGLRCGCSAGATSVAAEPGLCGSFWPCARNTRRKLASLAR